MQTKTTKRQITAAFLIAMGMLSARVAAFLVNYAIQDPSPPLARLGLGFFFVGEVLAYLFALTWHRWEMRAIFTAVMTIASSATFWHAFFYWDRGTIWTTAALSTMIEVATLITWNSLMTSPRSQETS